MKFTKFGKALLMGALSGGVILGVTSCVRSYTVGYIYVTGTYVTGTAQSNENGIISGYKIDHNTGFLTPIHGFPVASGGANPGRAVLVNGNRFLYVLNQGTNAQGGSTCTTDNPCINSNIMLFAVGGSGILTPQGSPYYSQGINPTRILTDSSGNFLLVLDHDSAAPNGLPSSATNPNLLCQRALGPSTTYCGDITVFQINQTTGRLTLVVNAQVTSASGSPLTYFPVPPNPIDFALANGYALTLGGTSTTGDTVFPYGFSSSNGQLILGQNSPQPLGITKGTAIINASNVIYVLDNEPVTITSTTGTFTAGTYPSQILPFSVGTNGALQAQTGGIIPDDPTLANPTYIMVESKGQFIYVANQGNNVTGTNPQSGIAGYTLNPSSSYQLKFLTPSTYGSGSGPQCLVEDPSDQFVYTANFGDSTISGRAVNPNSGVLTQLRVASSYKLQGPANWCLINGRTN